MSLTLGTAAALDSYSGTADHRTASICRLSDTKYLVAYVYASSSSGRAVICDVSGTTVTVGTPLVVVTGTDINDVKAVTLTSTTVAYFYSVPGDSIGKSLILSVSGSTITANTGYTFENAYTEWFDVCALSSTVLLLTYKKTTLTYYGKVCTISGTTMSFGSIVQIASDFNQYPSVVALSSTKAVVVYNISTTLYGRAKVATISGDSVSFGSLATFSTSSVANIKNLTKIADNKVALIYGVTSPSASTAVKIGTVGSTTISFGSASEIIDERGYYGLDILYTSKGQLVVIYNDPYDSGYPGMVAIGRNVAGTITFTEKTEYDSSISINSYIEELTTGKAIIVYEGHTRIVTIPTPVAVFNSKINIGDSWKTIDKIQINIGDSWKDVADANINIGDSWKNLDT